MKVGTKSVLFGAHCFFIHPFFVAAAWTRLYGFPFDPRLWVAFMIHDAGYWSLGDMDGDEGETHVEFGANLMQCWFGAEWGDFCRYHSRFYAKRDGKHFSRLCVADKLAVCLEPWWLYLPRVWASGEVVEYMARAGGQTDSKYNGEPETGKYASMNLISKNPSLSRWQKIRYWHARMTDYLRSWVEEHKDMREDTWTPNVKKEGAK